MEKSRTQHVAQNAIIGLLGQGATTILGFISRTVFIYVLGKEYLGVSGLFSNILMLLSFAELGIGNAMIYSMYKPAKEGNSETLKSLLALYKKAYQTIGCIVALLGLSALPFLDTLIHGTAEGIKEPISVLYILFLANSVVTYFFAYKQSVLFAYQNDYVVTLNTLVFYTISTGVQILFLLLTHDYIIYLIIAVVFSFLTNWSISRKVDKKYPELKGTAEILPHEVKKSIFKNVRALAVYKIGSVVLNGTSNIMLSYLFNVTSVGLYSNYSLFTNFFQTVNSKTMGALTSSVGNLNTESDKDKQYAIFNQILFSSVWLNGFAAVGMALLVNDVISIWIGNDYLFGKWTVFAIAFNYFIVTTSFATYVFRTTLGLFKQGQFAPVFATILNIILGIVLGKWIGFPGVFLAMALARMLSTGIIDPILVYRNAFKRPPLLYYIKYGGYILLMAILYIVINYIISFIVIDGVLGVMIKAIVIALVFHSIVILMFWRTSVLQCLISRFLSLLKNKI